MRTEPTGPDGSLDVPARRREPGPAVPRAVALGGGPVHTFHGVAVPGGLTTFPAYTLDAVESGGPAAFGHLVATALSALGAMSATMAVTGKVFE